MTDPRSRLTVKVRIQPAELPAELPAEQRLSHQAPWSVWRLLAALVVFAGVAALSFQLLQSAPSTATVSAEPAATLAEPADKAIVQAAEVAADINTAPSDRDMAAAASNANNQPVTTTAETVAKAEADTLALQPQTQPPAAQQAEAAQNTAQQVSDSQSVAPERIQLPAGFSRIVLTAAMRNLEPGAPAGQSIRYPAIQRLYLFTELKGYAGEVLRHRWYFQNTLHTEAVLTIEDSPWRTYSENWLLDNQRGDWRVQIVDQTEKVLFEYSFNYQ